MAASVGEAAAGADYFLLGTMFNHVNGLDFVKYATRGFVFENDWTFGNG